MQGSRLADRLHAEGHFVAIFDDCSRGPNLPKNDDDVRIDLRSEVPDFSGFNAVFHLAARVGGIAAGMDYEAMHDNLLIDCHVIEGAKKAKVGKLVYASSCATMLEPESGYGWAKRSGELLLGKSGLPFSILRLYNVYGPGEKAGRGAHVIPNLIYRAMHEKEVQVYGDGTQNRYFVYVDDAVDAYLSAYWHDPQVPIEIAGERATITEVAEMILQLLGSRKQLLYDRSLPRGPDPSSELGNQAWELLRWKPKTTLEKGLAKTIEWMK